MSFKLPKRPPDFIIGTREDPHIRRWWIIPRNPLLNVYLHQVLRSDADTLHDHPWWNCSIILDGGYGEELPGNRFKWRNKGDVIVRGGKDAHRLIIISGWAEYAVTLFITGPRFREWGFHCPKGWVPWHQYVDKRDGVSAVGGGCGEQS